MSVVSYILKLIFPERCIFCGHPTKLYSENPNVCEECSGRVHLLFFEKCIQCGADLQNHSNPYCPACHRMHFICTDGVSAFRYRDIKKTIFHFKYSGYRTDGPLLAKYMADCLLQGKCSGILNADTIVPVPISAKKEKKRGFNQTAVLAEVLSSELGIACCPDMLERVKNTVPQSRLTGLERKYNVMNVFKLNDRYEIQNKNILLVDDIFTTGSTIEECARILMLAGADKVYFVTLARTI